MDGLPPRDGAGSTELQGAGRAPTPSLDPTGKSEAPGVPAQGTQEPAAPGRPPPPEPLPGLGPWRRGRSIRFQQQALSAQAQALREMAMPGTEAHTLAEETLKLLSPPVPGSTVQPPGDPALVAGSQGAALAPPQQGRDRGSVPAGGAAVGFLQPQTPGLAPSGPVRSAPTPQGAERVSTNALLMDLAGPSAPTRRRFSLPMLAFLVCVLLPTLGAMVHAYGVAADLYVSESKFLVRGKSSGGGSTLLGALMAGGTVTSQSLEALAVQEFMISQDAVAALDRTIGLRGIYSRPEADWLARLPDDASPEDLVEFHRGMVHARIDSMSGIVTLRTFGWRPEDARNLAESLLLQSEQLVNRMNERIQEDALKTARTEVALAETRVADIRDQLTRFREVEKQIDPGQATSALLGIVTNLEGQLVQVKAEMAEIRAFMREDNPRLVNLRARASAIERQIAAERSKLTGQETARDGTFAQMISEYEKLQMKRQFADVGLASATTSLEQARVDAERQRLYLVRIVQPNLPAEALYPRRWLMVISTAAVALLGFGIMALLVAGVRDHIE